jgi:MFS family permease
LLSPLKFKDRFFYGWVVVIVFFATGVIFYGINFSFGVFFKSIESEFSLTRVATSSVLSAQMILAGVFAFFAGWTLDRYGPRLVLLLMGLFAGLSLVLTGQTNSMWQLFLTYSLLLAMGTGAIFVVPMSAVSKWFDKKRGLALGMASAGVGLGPVIMAPFATYLISSFSWRTAYIIIGLSAWLIVIPLSRLLKRDPYEIGALPDGVKACSKGAGSGEDNIQPTGLSLLQAVRTRSFWLIILIWVLYASNVFLVLTHLVPHTTDIGFSAMEAAAVLSLLGGAAIVGRVLMGIVSDRVGRKLTSIICVLLQAGAMVWLLWSEELWMLYLFALVYGFAFGGFSPATAALIGDTFGVSKIGSILGVLEIGFGAGAATGPVIGGLIYDVRGNYFLAFLLGALAMMVIALLIALIRKETEILKAGSQ